jgi:hypothetical protein
VAVVVVAAGSAAAAVAAVAVVAVAVAVNLRNGVNDNLKWNMSHADNMKGYVQWQDTAGCCF